MLAGGNGDAGSLMIIMVRELFLVRNGGKVGGGPGNCPLVGLPPH